MPQIHIERSHGLLVDQAHCLALEWAKAAHDEFGLQTQVSPDASDSPGHLRLHFSRTGVHGTLRVTHTHFWLDVHLGFLLGSFKDRIEAELLKNLDERLRALAETAKVQREKCEVSKVKNIVDN